MLLPCRLHPAKSRIAPWLLAWWVPGSGLQGRLAVKWKPVKSNYTHENSNTVSIACFLRHNVMFLKKKLSWQLLWRQVSLGKCVPEPWFLLQPLPSLYLHRAVPFLLLFLPNFVDFWQFLWVSCPESPKSSLWVAWLSAFCQPLSATFDIRCQSLPCHLELPMVNSSTWPKSKSHLCLISPLWLERISESRFSQCSMGLLC